MRSSHRTTTTPSWILMIKLTLQWILIVTPIPTKANNFQESKHEQNVALILSSSRFFHNYRHTSNALSMYQHLKQHGGYDDQHIILMLAEDVSCNPRNPFPNSIYSNRLSHTPANLYENVEVDYMGAEVTLSNLMTVLTNKHPPHTPSNKRFPAKALTNVTNVLIYITGHGGDEFFKLQDVEDVTKQDFFNLFKQMEIMELYHEILFVSDTCQAFSLAPNANDNHDDDDKNMVRNVISVASSLKGQNSYAYNTDTDIGHSVLDRYVHFFSQYMNHKWNRMTTIPLQTAMVDSFHVHGKSVLGNNVQVGWRDAACHRTMDRIPMSDFFVMRQAVPRYLWESEEEYVRVALASTNGGVDVLAGVYEPTVKVVTHKADLGRWEEDWNSFVPHGDGGTIGTRHDIPQQEPYHPHLQSHSQQRDDGRHSSNPLFVGSVIFLFILVHCFSQRW